MLAGICCTWRYLFCPDFKTSSPTTSSRGVAVLVRVIALVVSGLAFVLAVAVVVVVAAAAAAAAVVEVADVVAIVV